MSGWCYGDDLLCFRTARAWPTERISAFIGKSVRKIRKRHPAARQGLTMSAEVAGRVAALLPGRTLAQVGAHLDMSAEDVAAVCDVFDLLAPYEAGDGRSVATWHQAEITESDKAAIKRMRAAGLLYSEIASTLGRTEESVKTVARKRLGLAPKASPAYSAEDDAALASMFAAGADSKEVAKALGRSRDSVRARKRALRIASKSDGETT